MYVVWEVELDGPFGSGNQESRTGKEATVTCLPEPQPAIFGLTVKDTVIIEIRSHLGLMVPFTIDKRKASWAEGAHKPSIPKYWCSSMHHEPFPPGSLLWLLCLSLISNFSCHSWSASHNYLLFGSALWSGLHMSPALDNPFMAEIKSLNNHLLLLCQSSVIIGLIQIYVPNKFPLNCGTKKWNSYPGSQD